MSKLLYCIVCVTAQIISYGINPSFAQSVSSGAVRVTETRRIPLNGPLVGDAHCDRNGNMYFRVLDEENSRRPYPTSHLAIRKLNKSGALGQIFEMPSDPSDLRASDFFVTSDGIIYLASHRLADQSAYVVRFSPNGDRILIALDFQRFWPRQIVVFGSGEMMLSGTNGPSNHTPFTALFAADGKLLKKIYEPEDEDARKRAEALDPNYVYKESDNTTVVTGDAVLGSDGNAYLLRSVSPALIYVISSKGVVVRKLRVESPAPRLVAQGLRSADGKLAISFLEPFSTVGSVSVVDLNGILLSELVSNDKTTNFGLPGCYDGEAFSLLHADENNDVTLRRARVN